MICICRSLFIFLILCSNLQMTFLTWVDITLTSSLVNVSYIQPLPAHLVRCFCLSTLFSTLYDNPQVSSAEFLQPLFFFFTKIEKFYIGDLFYLFFFWSSHPTSYLVLPTPLTWGIPSSNLLVASSLKLSFFFSRLLAFYVFLLTVGGSEASLHI